MRLHWFIVVVWGVTLIAGCKKDRPDFDIEYEVSLQCLWSVNSHPSDYPQTATLAPFGVFSHKANVELFQVGIPCSYGMRIMAEQGDLELLEEEIDVLRGGGQALDRDMGDAISFLRTSTILLGFSEEHTQLTLVAKISPSPDWFVATKGLELYANGAWIDSLEVFPETYDAGTDRGQTFLSANIPTEPAEMVTVINSQPLADNGVVPPLAKITVRRVQ